MKGQTADIAELESIAKATTGSILKKYWWKVVLAPILKLFEVASELLTPFLIRYIIDVGVANGNAAYVWKYGLIILCMAIVGFGITMAAQYLAARVSADFGYDLRKELFSKISSLSESQLSTYGKQKALTLINNDSFAIQNGVMMFMRLILRPPFLLIGSIILSFTIGAWAGLVVAGAIVFSGIVIGLVILLSPKRYAKVQDSLDSLSTSAGDALKGSRQVRAFNKEEFEIKRFSEKTNEYKKASIKVFDVNSWINPLTFCFINVGIAMVVVFGTSIAKQAPGSVKTGELVSLLSYLSTCLMALVMFSRMIVSVNKALASNRRVNAFLALENTMKDGVNLVKASQSGEIIRFENVCFKYSMSSENNVLKDVSFAIKEGQTIGIIGGTGSGKSTLLALIERIYDPYSGTIFFAGSDIKDLSLDELRSHISIVSQKPSIFKGTIRSNLLLGNASFPDEKLLWAARQSLAYEYIAAFADGLDHPVEEGGTNLSGGQKQRLLIARAILHGGDVLILDDSTSALDYLSDRKVRENISKLDIKTKIIVSQRATSLMNCDQILVLENGSLVGKGTHEELLRSCREYREIYEMQVANR